MGISWLIRLFGKLFKLAIGLYGIMSLAMLAWTFLWPDPEDVATAPADAILCLGGGMDADGVLAQATLNRVTRCVALYDAGLAPIVIFTGGTPTPQSPSAGGQMGLYAQSLGLPASAIITEPRAQSTLQNALFSLALFPDPKRLIVVTEAFHLPRSWASVKWAAWESGMAQPSLSLVMSEDVRRDPATGKANVNILFRESIAIWFNGFRAIAYSVASKTDWTDAPPEDWLY